MNNVVEEVKKFVKLEFWKESSKYKNSYEGHFVLVVGRALELAEIKNKNGEKVDIEVIEIAAWLHDIGSIVYGRENHHITSAKIAEEKLNELNYSKNKIKLVKSCILNHRGSQNNERESVEEKIISDADAISAFDNIAGLFEAAIVWEKLSQKNATKSVFDKLSRKYNQLFFDESKEIINEKYVAVKVLFGNL